MVKLRFSQIILNYMKMIPNTGLCSADLAYKQDWGPLRQLHGFGGSGAGAGAGGG